MSKKNNSIDYLLFIKRALIEFGELDVLDIKLLIEDYQSRPDHIKLKNLVQLNRYLELKDYMILYEDRSIKFMEGYGPDSKTGNITIRNKIISKTPEMVNDYFSSLDKKTFKLKKQEAETAIVSKAAEDCNVLLLSDDEEDLEQLRAVGFTHIDQFTSLTEADWYFNMHPELLERYQLIVNNMDLETPEYWNAINLLIRIGDLDRRRTINAALTNNNQDYKLSFYDIRIKGHWSKSSQERQELYKSLAKKVATMPERSIQMPIEIKRDSNPPQLPLPQTKASLKILYLEKLGEIDYSPNLAEKLGVNITCMPEDEYTLGTSTQYKLGDYDIIIAPEESSSKLLEMVNEANYQCQATGRQLVLLLTYDYKTVNVLKEYTDYDYDSHGDKVTLRSISAGPLGTKNPCLKEYHVLKKEIKPYPYMIDCEEVVKSILEEAVCQYNNVLIENNQSKIEDLDATSCEAHEDEFQKFEEEYELRTNPDMQAIAKYDKLKNTVNEYLESKNNKPLFKSTKDLDILETETAVIVGVKRLGTIIGTITYSKSEEFLASDNIRTFGIQTLNKKGKLASPTVVGIYTKKYEGLSSTPPKPTYQEMQTFNVICQKVSDIIEPLNKRAKKKATDDSKQKVKSNKQS